MTRLAGDLKLGGLIDIRRQITMGSALALGGGVAVGSGIVMALLTAIPSATSAFSLTYAVVRIFALLFFFAMVWGIVLVIRGLLVGSRTCFLYEGGLVATRRTGPIAVTWPQVTGLKTIYKRSQGQEGRVAGYRVQAQSGPALAIPLVLVNNRDAFMDHVIANVRALGRPIAEPNMTAQPGAIPPYPAAPYHGVNDAQRQIWQTKGKRGIGFGVAWLLGGLIITAATYANSSGAVYIVAYGPMLYGIYRIVAGALLLRKSRPTLARYRSSPGHQASNK